LEINQGYTTMHGQPVIKYFMDVIGRYENNFNWS